MSKRRGWRTVRAGLVAASLLAASLAQAAPLTLPAMTRARLGNGLTVLVVPSTRLPLVDFRLVARVGSVDDPAGKEGLAALTAELLTQGAAGRSATQIAGDIAFVGGTLAAGAGREQITVSCEVLRKDFDTGLALFRDVIASPSFPAEEFQRQRDEALGQIAAQRNDPSTVADLALGPFLLGDSPLAHPVLGSARSVATLTREDVVAFHGRFMRPDNAVLAVVGDVDPRATVAALEKAFAGWKSSGEKRPESYRAVPQLPGRRLRVIRRAEITQTQIRMACMGVPRNHPDYYPIQVANTILGGGFTSRLVDEVRVHQGLTYGISSDFTMWRNAGTFGISTFTRNESIRQLVDAVLAEVARLRDQGPREEELASAKRYLTGQFPLGLQSPDDLAEQILAVEFYGLEPDHLQGFSARIDAVTMEDVRRALKSYFCVEDLRILLVSNPEAALPLLQGLGTVEVEDPE